MTPLQRFLRSNVYSLFRRWGRPLEVFSESSVTFDPKTGERTIDKDRLYVRRALIWDYRADTNFTYSIQYIRANSNFAQGGFYELEDRFVAIANQDVGEFVLNENSYVVVDGKRYSIVTIQNLEVEGAYLLKVREVKGQAPNRQISATIGNSTRVGGEFES
jgi:hypothetical protein